ncbi:MAG: ISLre2 family transposase, partial [Clostridia bacterium]|nr:ISLre2 family transposase [Clostridia bacterium]
GVGIGYQRARIKRGEIKLGVAYEGRKAYNRNRQELASRRVFGADVEGREFWEQASAQWSRSFALEQAGQVLLGGDGASR